MTEIVGVVGASARAAVHSLARAGLGAWAVDQFADRDLKRVAQCALCTPSHYPDAIPSLAGQFPPGPVLYTGGLENHPPIIAALAAQRDLWGNPPDVLARVRNPFTLFPALAAAGFATPRLVPHHQPSPTEGRWLRKPLHSGGGLGIRFAKVGEAVSCQHYHQEFIDGVPMSAIYRDATLFGITQQLIGEPWLHAKPFVYCGNIGAGWVPTSSVGTLWRLGTTLVEGANLSGVWGVDFILNESDPIVVEVNPRYTASVEVLEHAMRKAMFREYLPHQSPERPTPQPPPCREGEFASTPSLQGGGWGVGLLTIGKAIYYAPHALRFPSNSPWDADLSAEFDPWRVPLFADIPEPVSAIQAGWPVLTFFTTGSTPAEVRQRLQSRAAELDRLFRDAQP